MSKEKELMIAALKNNVITFLRTEGFKGSFPKFYRQNGKQADFIFFSFSIYGGRLDISAGKYPTVDFRKTPKPDSLKIKNKINGSFSLDNTTKAQKKSNKKSLLSLVKEYEKTLDENVFDEVAEKVLKFIKTKVTKIWNK